MKRTYRRYRHLSSVYRAIKRFRPNDSDIVVFRELIDGKRMFGVWL